MNTFKRHSRKFVCLAITLISILLLSLGLTSSSAQQTEPLTFQISIVDATGAAKSSFYLGETVALKLSVTNVSATPQTIITLNQSPISLTLSVNRNGEDVTGVRQTLIGGNSGTRIIGGSTVFTEGRLTDTTLAPGQNVQVLIPNLGNTFGFRMGDGNYVLKAVYSPTLSAQASFSVAISEAQSIPVLEQMAATGDEDAQLWANSFLDLIRKPSISGRIADASGAAVGGVELTITGAQFTNQKNLSDGRYSLSGLSSGGNYTITPSLKGYTFEPATHAFTNLTTKLLNVNFTATKAAAGDSVARKSSGATVTASSTFDVDYRAEGAINGFTYGDWGTGSGGWQDGTPNVFPDWIEINFGAPKPIDWINVYTLQDNFANPTAPTLTETFSLYGIVDFDVQYWNGSAWITVPGGTVNGNNKVWRKFSFPTTITTSKIRVNVRNALGGHSRITEIEAFHVNKPPTVSIPGTLQGAPGTAVQFTSDATDSDGTISNYEWDFGDDTGGAGPSPSHTYAVAGTYTVTLTVTDNAGETATATRTIKISGPPQTPVAKPGGPYIGFPGTSIVFDGRASFDPDGSIVSYLWDFGDNTGAPGAAPSHSYSQPGTYIARLMVTDDSGSTNIATTVATIATNQPAPTNLGGVTWCQIHLHWVDNSTDETGFLVELSTDNGQTFVTHQALPANTRQALSLPRPNHTQGDFIYRIRATNAQGVSAPSNTYVATPLCNGCSCQSGTPTFGPDVRMTAPITGTTVGAGATVSLVAQVSAANPLSSVKFYRGTTFIGDGTLLTPATSPPSYVFNWQNVPAGNYSLTATASEAGGLTGTSTAVSLSVVAPPTVSISSPANGARFAPPGNIVINATASATNGTISKVEFFQGNNKIGEDTSAPYSFSWNNVASGAYQLTAKATDSNQLSTTSTPVNTIVNSLPVVTLTSPANNQVFQAPGHITLSANASEVNGAITKVDFYRGPNLIGTATSAPYTVTWSNVAAGSYLLSATATDSFGVIASSGSISINVGNPPTVSMTAPVNEAHLSPSITQLTANASTSNGVISKVEFFRDSTKLGEDATAPYTLNWLSSATGRFQLTAKATDSLSLTATSTPISVLVDVAPIVNLSAPANGEVFHAPGTVTLNATASDSDGTISEVAFYRGTTLIGTDTSSPYSYTWSNVAAGNYSITAVARDNFGVTTTSNANSIVVNAKPSVSISSPASGATFIGPATINITAASADADGTVSKVEFYQGAVKLGEDTIAPYSFSWTNVAVGNYVLTAKATDNHGGVSTSSSVGVTVNANSLPTVSITNPLNNVVFPAPASITIYASAADSDGTINKVEFFQGTTLIGTATTNPYTLIWSNVAAGTYSVTAKATDNLGATRTSTAVNVIVNSLPAITITSPANNSNLTAPVNTVINVNASDANGTVSKVEFFDGSTKLGESLAAPFSFNWNAVPVGIHTVTAKATDNHGGVTTSAPVTITVTSPYSYRRTITIDHTKVPNTDLSNFPLLIKGTYPYLATVSNGGSVQNANGYDVIFTSDLGCSAKLDHEVEMYSASTGTVNYWVKVPLLSHSTDTVIYMCYGSSTITTDQSNKTGVWDANYKAVYHLKDGTTLNVTDATANHDLTNNGATATAGQVDGAGNFNGSTQYLSVAGHSDFSWTSLRTIEFWVKLGSNTQTIPRLFSNSDGGSDAWSITWAEPMSVAPYGLTGNFLIVSLGSQAIPTIQKQTPDNGTINSTAAWHHVAVVGNGTTVSNIYINGNPVTVSTYPGNITNTTTPGLNIGRRNNNARYFNGGLDEIRFSNSQRSADWIRTGYNNQSSPSTFYTISAQ